MLTPWKKRCNKARQCIKKQRYHFANRGPYSQTCGLSSGHMWMWELDHKENWKLKTWQFQIVVLEKTIENPLDSKEIKPISPKGNQPQIFIGGTDAEAEAPVLWPPDAQSKLTEKKQKQKITRCWERLRTGGEGDNRGCHHWLNGCEFEQTVQEIVKDREA